MSCALEPFCGTNIPLEANLPARTGGVFPAYRRPVRLYDAGQPRPKEFLAALFHSWREASLPSFRAAARKGQGQ